jgi:2-methylcitrate dehydratase PrpD
MSSRLDRPPPRRRAGCLASIPRRSRTPSRQVAATIDAVGVLADRHGFRADDVTAVEVHVPAFYRPMIDRPSGSGRTWSLVSAQYQVSARLLHPQDRFDCARSVLRDSSAFRRLMGVVRVYEEDALAVRHPESYPARVAVTPRNGLTADFLSDGRVPALIGTGTRC